MAGILDRIKNGVAKVVQKVKDKVEAFLEDKFGEGREDKKEQRSSPSAQSAPAPAPARPAPAPEKPAPQPRVAGYRDAPAHPSLNHPALDKQVGQTGKGTPIHASPNFGGTVKTEKGEIAITLPMINGKSLTVKVPESVIDNGGRVTAEPNGQIRVYKNKEDLAAGRSQSMDMSPEVRQNGGVVRMDEKGQMQSKPAPQMNERTTAAMHTLNGHGGTERTASSQVPGQGQGQSAPAQTPQNPAHAAQQKQPAGAAR